jgi:hypothetical protein
MLERREGPFIAPEENVAIGVSETQTCPGRGPDMSGKHLWKLAWGPDMSGLRLSRRGIGLSRTCPGWWPDMSGKCLWNPA